jgi:hypothetical protein
LLHLLSDRGPAIARELERAALFRFGRRPDRRHNLLGVVEASSSLLRRCNVYHMIKVYT